MACKARLLVCKFYHSISALYIVSIYSCTDTGKIISKYGGVGVSVSILLSRNYSFLKYLIGLVLLILRALLPMVNILIRTTTTEGIMASRKLNEV